MSYDIDLLEPGTDETCQVAHHHIRGGTYQVGGTTEASLSVTFNYGKHYYKYLKDGLRSLHGKTAAETLDDLRRTRDSLKGDGEQHGDYWEGNEENAKAALCDLITIGEMRPDGVWSVLS